MTQNTEQDRAEFEARFKHLDLTQEPDAWGAPRYKHDAISLAWEAWQAARRAPAVPVPQSIEQMAVDRYKVVPSHESMFHRWAVVADNGTQQLYIGREVECLNMARKFAGAFLDGAFVAMQNTAPAHTAEGVPAQCPNINEPRGCWRVACQLEGKCREPERSATQPAAQGMDALTPAARDVLAERKRQIESEGWKTERDDVLATKTSEIDMKDVVLHEGVFLKKGSDAYALWEAKKWKELTEHMKKVREAAIKRGEIRG